MPKCRKSRANKIASSCAILLGNMRGLMWIKSGTVKEKFDCKLLYAENKGSIRVKLLGVRGRPGYRGSETTKVEPR